MIRAVLDTNVLASAAIAHPGTTLATILDNVVANRFDLAISEYILVELRRTLATPYYATRITPAAAARYVQLLIPWVQPSELVRPCKASRPILRMTRSSRLRCQFELTTS
jgi:predicted nucleic acid-binding protein